MVPQALEGLSDRDAATQLRTNIEWKVAAELPVTDPGFHPTVLTLWRNRLCSCADTSKDLRRRAGGHFCKLSGSMGRVSSAGDNAAIGVLLFAVTEERPRPPALEDTRRIRYAIVFWIDRAHLQPPPRRQRAVSASSPSSCSSSPSRQESMTHQRDHT